MTWLLIHYWPAETTRCRNTIVTTYVIDSLVEIMGASLYLFLRKSIDVAHSQLQPISHSYMSSDQALRGLSEVFTSRDIHHFALIQLLFVCGSSRIPSNRYRLVFWLLFERCKMNLIMILPFSLHTGNAVHFVFSQHSSICFILSSGGARVSFVIWITAVCWSKLSSI